MATTTAASAKPTINDGGTVVYGGTVAGNVTNAPGLTHVGIHNNQYGNWQLSSSGNTAPYWKRSVPTADTGATTHVIRLVSANIIIPGSARFLRARAYNDTWRTTRFINPALTLTGGWSYTTGLPLQGLPASGSNDDFSATGTVFIPTRALPGEYTLLETGRTPTQGDYEAKTG